MQARIFADVCVLIASGRTAPSNAMSERNVRLTLHPALRLAFQRQVRQTHRTHRTQGIIFADVVNLESYSVKLPRNNCPPVLE